MKKHKLIIADQAREDLMDIWLYIASESITGADKFIDFLYEKCTNLCSTPEIGMKPTSPMTDRMSPIIRWL